MPPQLTGGAVKIRRPMSDIQDECWANSRRWFPELHERRWWEQMLHQTLGLAGEAGEVANKIKKADLRNQTYAKEWVDDIGSELADVVTYAFNVASLLQIDLSIAIADKQAICEERWG
jgi:NTP pyrophosphatase (non-canonical NTP hydrolase)